MVLPTELKHPRPSVLVRPVLCGKGAYWVTWDGREAGYAKSRDRLVGWRHYETYLAGRSN